ncbi:hypothetical protein SeMB42_g05793 [Synchytrium endobioticum]|uniref:Uncharacterized protein n=1 Tax=Synchytrium endobioticum TaxID=286115 RepID=A0A507CPC5_9FUNG|nr:hypothetical protein SeMB42_g05793 [Synchytrium endobioticum]TPX50927.1 hypothetical protein SeLEV6574_g00614 [Synchytrium endobioticum]
MLRCFGLLSNSAAFIKLFPSIYEDSVINIAHLVFCAMEMFDFKLKPSFPSTNASRELSASPSDEASWFDLSEVLEPPLPKHLYLMHDKDYLSRLGNETGIADALKSIGYHQLVLRLSTDAFVSRFTVSDASLLHAQKENMENFTIKGDNYLIDVHTRAYKVRYHQINAYQSLLRLSNPSNEDSIERVDPTVFAPSRCAAVASFIESSWPHRTPSIEQKWVCLQDPKAEFSTEKPRLPGQRYPGLGIGKLFLETTATAVAEKGYGMFFTPEHFHNAVLYQKAGSRFASPLMEGYFQALCEDIAPLIEEKGLSAVSWALGEGRIVDVSFGCDGEQKSRVMKYLAQEQLAPISPPILQYLDSPQYKAFAEEAYSIAKGRTYSFA